MNRVKNSDTEQLVKPVLLGIDFAVLDDIVAVSQILGEAEVLLNQHNREALALKLTDHLAEHLCNHGGQTVSDLVEQQQLGIERERGVM